MDQAAYALQNRSIKIPSERRKPVSPCDLFPHPSMTNTVTSPANENALMVKTTFSGWHSISKEDATSYAKWKLNAITMGESDEERLAIVNSKFKGISFTLKDLV